MGVWQKAKGIGFGLVLFVTALYGALVFGGGPLVILFIRPRLYRRIFDWAISTWQWLVVALLEKWLGLHVIITGDKIRADEQSLIIMNHRTCLDWLYFWAVLIRQSGVAQEKIILKAPLKNIPGAGWAMQAAAYMFLNRRWEEDENYLSTMINYFRQIHYKTQILLFPEGTDFNVRSKARSDTFALTKGLKPYQHVLHPKTTGFTHIISQLKEKWVDDAAVYDVTVAYSSSPIPQTERDLVRGVFANRVHFHITRHEMSTVPADANGWCRSRWAEKESRLETFHKTLCFACNETPETPGIGKWLYLSFFWWFSIIVLFTYAFIWSSVVRWITLVYVIFFVVMTPCYGGFELFQARYALGLVNRKKVV